MRAANMSASSLGDTHSFRMEGESQRYTGAEDDEARAHNDGTEAEASSFYSLSLVSTLGTSLYGVVVGFVLVASIVFLNVEHWSFSGAIVREFDACAVAITSSFVSHSKFVLLGVSCVILVAYITLSLLGIWFLRRIAVEMEGELCHLLYIFDLLNKLRLEHVPVYVNEQSSIGVTRDKGPLLVHYYSDCAELQKAQSAINDISLALCLFRKALPDAVFKKESAGEFESPTRDGAGMRVPAGQLLSSHLGNNASSRPSFSEGQRATSQVVGQHEYSATHRDDDARSAVLLSHESPRRLVESENSHRTLNISEIRGGVESGLKKKKVTVVVASLEGFALHVDENLRYCHDLSEQFLFIVRDIADRYGGTILSATPDRVIAVWNAFSDVPNHERCGMQYACDTIAALESFISAMIASMRINLTHVVVATSGYVLAGVVGAEEERAMAVHGSCVALAEELPSLLIALRIKCACTGSLSENCPALFSCIPVDYVTDADNNQHDLYEIVETPLPYHNRLIQAFHAFRCGRYSAAESMYAAVYDENHADWQALRLSQLCAYLRTTGKVYQRHVPKWQLFPVELDAPDRVAMQRSKDLYHWRKPEASSVEEQLRRAILIGTATRRITASPDEGIHHTENPPYRRACRLSCQNSPEPVQKCPVTEFRDRQGMMFRMSDCILGTGAYGSVSMGLSQTGALVAIKQIELPMIRHAKNKTVSAVNRRRLQRKGIKVEGNVEEALNVIISEVGLLSRLRHANIVGYITCAILDNKLLLVMELASGGSLYNMLRQFAKVKVSRAKRYLRDVLKGLEYLHRQNIVHRDIKPQNVLLLENGLCKLSDFGTSQSLQMISNTSRPEGTPPYIAPEAARGVAEKASDIWSFGIMMAQILSGSLPWPDADKLTPHAFLYNVGHVESFVPQVDDRVLADAREIIMQCCRRTPSERPTAEQLLKDAYFSTAKSYANSSVLGRHTLCADKHLPNVSRIGSNVKRQI